MSRAAAAVRRWRFVSFVTNTVGIKSLDNLDSGIPEASRNGLQVGGVALPTDLPAVHWQQYCCQCTSILVYYTSSTFTVMQFASCKHFWVQSSAIAKSLVMTCALNENMYNSCRCSRCAVHTVHQCIAFIFKDGFVAPLCPPTDCGVGYSPAGEQLAGLPAAAWAPA